MTILSRKSAPPTSRRLFAVLLLLLTTFASAFGQLAAWGYGSLGQLDVPAGLGEHTVAIAAGDYHTIALTQDGKVVGWGSNNWGEANAPPELNDQTVVAISAGSLFSLALNSEGKVFSWGLGASVPPELDKETVVAISARGYHCLALTNFGKVYAWGNSPIADETKVPESLNGKTVVAIAAGFRHNLVLTNTGEVIAWGDNKYSECDVPNFEGLPIVSVAAGQDFSIALTSTGRVFAWGDNFEGQCDLPNAVRFGTITSVSCGSSHTLAINSLGKVLAWGYNLYGQTDVPEGLNEGTIIAVAAGFGHSVAFYRPADSEPNAFSLTLSEHSGVFTGGKSAPVTATFAFPAAVASDTLIALSSSSDAVSVPPTVVVPAGKKFVKFVVKSTTVADRTIVRLTALDPDSKKTVVKFILKPQSCKVVVAPRAFLGGTTATGSLVLETTSATDTLVNTGSSSPFIKFNQVIVIPANQTLATFSFDTSPVPVKIGANIDVKPGISSAWNTQAITLLPAPSIASFTASRTRLYNNQLTTLTIKLASSGTAGTTVFLSATSPGLNIPSQIFFPAGVRSLSFDVLADKSASGGITLTASCGASYINRVVNIDPLEVSSLSFAASSIKGGSTVNVALKLNGIVDVDTVVNVGSNNPTFVVSPKTVTVFAGSDSASYTLTTRPTRNQRTVAVFANRAAVTVTKRLTITP